MAVKTLSYFGAKGNGKTDDSAAFKKAMGEYIHGKGGAIEAIPQKVYKVNDPVVISNFKGSFLFNGQGSVITTDNPDITLFTKKVVNQTDALNQVNSKIRWQNIEFLGTGSGKQNAIKIQATYGSKFENVNTTAMGKHIELQFCLAARVEQCYGTNNKHADFTATIGDWEGADESNSQSNHVVFESCRSYGDEKQTRAYYIGGSSGVCIYNSIIEGRNTLRGIEFNDMGSPVVKVFNVHNLHVENAPEEAALWLRMRGGIADIHFFAQIPKTVLVKCTKDTGADILLKELPWLSDGVTFESEGQGGNWQFKNFKSNYIQAEKFWEKYFPKGKPFYKTLEFSNGQFENGEGK